MCSSPSLEAPSKPSFWFHWRPMSLCASPDTANTAALQHVLRSAVLLCCVAAATSCTQAVSQSLYELHLNLLQQLPQQLLWLLHSLLELGDPEGASCLMRSLSVSHNTAQPSVLEAGVPAEKSWLCSGLKQDLSQHVVRHCCHRAPLVGVSNLGCNLMLAKRRLTATNNFKEECLAGTVVFWEDQVVI